MSTIFHSGIKILRQRIIRNHHYASIADFLYFRVSGSKYFTNSGKQFFLLPNVEHICEYTDLKNTTVKNALTFLRQNDWITSDRIRCYDGAVRTRIFVTDKFKELMLEIEALKYKDNQAVSDESTEVKKSKTRTSKNTHHKMAQSSQSNIMKLVDDTTEKSIVGDTNLDSPKYDQSDSPYFDQSYIIEQTKKENNNNVNNIESKCNKDSSYQNNVSNVSFNLDFLKIFDNTNYANECKKIIDQVAFDNQVCDQNLAIIILELAELQVYKSNKQLVDDAITLTKRIANKSYSKIPVGEGHSLGKILKASPSQRMSSLTPIQTLSVAKMLDYLESKKNVRLTNKQEVFSWIEYQLINPEYHFKDLTFRHALNVIAKTLQNRGVQGYCKPFGYVA
jgi:hypothetical protein